MLIPLPLLMWLASMTGSPVIVVIPPNQPPQYHIAPAPDTPVTPAVTPKAEDTPAVKPNRWIQPDTPAWFRIPV